MATARLNVSLEGFSGKLGGLLFRRYPHKQVVGPLPDYSQRKRSGKQKGWSRTFGDAQLETAALLDDPQVEPAITRCARRRRKEPHDYLMHYLLKEHKPGQPFPWDTPPPSKPASKGKARSESRKG
jgi:hypothetical protein